MTYPTIQPQGNMMNKNAILFSSARRNGNTGSLINDVAKGSQADIFDLRDYNISEYDYDHKNIGDDFIPLFKEIVSYQNIIFASPVYWDSVSPGMKIFLDRISDLLDIEELSDLGRQLRLKQAYVVSTSIQEAISPNFLGAFKATFNYLGMKYGGCLHIDCRSGYLSGSSKEQVNNFIHTLD